MSQDQSRLFVSLSQEIKLASAETARRKAEVQAAIDKAKEQLAASHELLAQLDSLLSRK